MSTLRFLSNDTYLATESARKLCRRLGDEGGFCNRIWCTRIVAYPAVVSYQYSRGTLAALAPVAPAPWDNYPALVAIPSATVRAGASHHSHIYSYPPFALPFGPLFPPKMTVEIRDLQRRRSHVRWPTTFHHVVHSATRISPCVAWYCLSTILAQEA